MANDIGYANKAPAPLNPLPGALNALGYSVGELETAVQNIRDRINGVMTPATPMPVTAGVERQPTQLVAAPHPVSDVTGSIEMHSRRIDVLTMQLGDMLARLET
jgi:hypothetical protein